MGVLTIAKKSSSAAQKAKQTVSTTSDVVKANQSTILRAATPGGSATDDVFDAAAGEVTRRTFSKQVGQMAANNAGKRVGRESSSRLAATVIGPAALASRTLLLVALGFREAVAVVSDSVTSVFGIAYLWGRHATEKMGA